MFFPPEIKSFNFKSSFPYRKKSPFGKILKKKKTVCFSPYLQSRFYKPYTTILVFENVHSIKTRCFKEEGDVTQQQQQPVNLLKKNLILKLVSAQWSGSVSYDVL